MSKWKIQLQEIFKNILNLNPDQTLNIRFIFQDKKLGS
jgi:hypothetical protein